MKLFVAFLLCVGCRVGLCENTIIDPSSIKLLVTNSQVKDWDASNDTLDVFVDWWIYYRNNSAIEPTPAAFELRLSCEADFPIVWNITGDIKEPEVLKIQPNKRRFLPDRKFSYILSVIVFFEVDSQSSSTFYCQSVENPEVKKSLDVFRDGKQSHPFIHSRESIQVEDSKILPCSVGNASLDVFLQKQDINTGKYETVTQDFEYNPRLGFLSDRMFAGYYVCKIKNVDDEVNVEATVRRSVVLDHDYLPRVQNIKVFTSEPVRLECAARSKRANIKIKVVNQDSLRIEDGPKEPTNQAFINVYSNGTKGNYIAVCENDVDKKVIWRWEIEFVEPPELYLNNFEGEVVCLSDYEDRTVSTVRCVNPSHCEFMKHCFADPTYCNDKRQKQFFSDDVGDDRSLKCWLDELEESKECVRVSYSHLNGVVECKARGLARHWLFFNSLESTKLYDYHKAETNELIQMDSVPQILYTNITTKFFCKAVIFLVADSIIFEMMFANSSTKLMHETLTPEGENRRRIEEGNVIGELVTSVPLDAVGIRCLAPLWNSSSVFQVEQRFVTRHLQKPSFRGEPLITQLAVTETRRRLNCSASGEPRPKYLWRKEGNILEPSDKYQFIIGLNGESLLEFSIIDEAIRGEYECEASNNADFLLGNCPTDSNTSSCGIARATKVFRVEDIQIGGAWTGTAAFSATIAIVLIILICVCILLVFVMQRYLIAKELIRNLTDNEIDEFFNGNPALLGATGQLGPEFLDLIPYDNHYELDLDEVQFDLSKVLGEGEFSTVVQGFWVPQSRNVAVKIAKPSTDVSLFKNLLSEVKIMIHIGGHPNILSLLGVCTKSIRNRNIYIVMELCNHGSLDILLRKNRRTYINLLDGNQKIDPCETKADVGSTGTKITTLTLIRWSGEIACGMEFLSYKGVVHADLAARNVLIGPNWEAKVSDFGLSRKLYESTNYVKKSKTPLPWRWMAAESLMSLSFSTESDIWSYGVTIWEIFTLGDIPFPNEAWDKDFLNRIATGMRMGKPKYANPKIYSQIIACWDEDPSLRPQFTNHRKFFLGLYTSHTGEPEPGEYIHKTKTSLRPLSNYVEVSEESPLNPSEESETETTIQPHLYGNVDLVGNEMYSNAQR